MKEDEKIKEVIALQDLRQCISWFGYGFLKLKTLDSLKAEVDTRLERAVKGTPFDVKAV